MALTAAEAEIEAVVARLKAREMAFDQAIPQAVAKYPALAGLLAFSEQRTQVLGFADTSQAHQDEIAIDAAHVAPILELIGQAEIRLSLGATESFPIRVQSLQAALGRHEQEHTEFLRDQREEQSVQGQLQLAQAELERLGLEHRAWRSAWPVAIGALGMAPDSDPAGAGQLITEWAGARGILGAIAQTRHRLKRMDQDEQQLADNVAAAAEVLGLDIPDDCVAAAKMLMARWEGNKIIRVQRDGLLPDFEEAKVETQYAETNLEVAEQEIQKLAATLGIAADEAVMSTAALRYDEHAHPTSEIAWTERTITDVGEQLAITALRAEWAERDLDRLGGALQDARARAGEVESEIEVAVRAEKEAQDGLAGYLAETHVHLAVVEREGASAQMHLTLERYLELTVARELVVTAMARIRAEQQDPLIRRAAALFAATTRDESSDIETDTMPRGSLSSLVAARTARRSR